MKALLLNRCNALPGVAESLALKLAEQVKPGAIILLDPAEFQLCKSGIWIDCDEVKPDAAQEAAQHVAYTTGREDGRGGYNLCDNPYSAKYGRESEQALAWNEGWKDETWSTLRGAQRQASGSD